MTPRLRVRYRERQPLGVDDLVAEQEFRLAQRHHHDRSLHSWGIVSGLTLTVEPSAMVVRPGLAIDSYGQSLAVTKSWPVGFDVLDSVGTAVDVWLVAQECRLGDRTADRAALRLTANSDVEPRRPHDAGTALPVYLGRVWKDDAGHCASPERRRYTGLTGSSVIAPNGRARMSIDGVFAGDRRRFVVATGPDGHTERIRLDQDGQFHLTGDAIVEGPLRMASHGAGFPSELGFAAPSAPPARPSPWQVCRATEQGRDRLQFELHNPGTNGNPALHAFVIGRRTAGVFTPVLASDTRGTTTIRGRLSVLGGIVEGPVKPDLSDPRLSALLYRTWSLANATAGLRLDERYRGALAITVQPTGGPGPASKASYTVQVRNTGPVPLGPVIVATSVVARPGPGLASQTERVNTLAPGLTHSTGGSIQPTGLGDQTIEATVVAVGRNPAQARVYNSVTLSWLFKIGPQP